MNCRVLLKAWLEQLGPCTGLSVDPVMLGVGYCRNKTFLLLSDCCREFLCVAGNENLWWFASNFSPRNLGGGGKACGRGA